MCKRIKLLITAILIVMLSGCWDQRVYEQIGFILQVGLESHEKDQLLVTLTSPVVGGEISSQVELLEVHSKNLRESREQARMSSPKTLEAGKIQQILISKELAERGIHNLIEVYERDPANPALALIVIVDGSPNELLKMAAAFTDKPRTAFYINQLIEGNIRSSYIPETRVYDFDIMYTAPGLDPIAPMIALEGNNISIIGTALFHEDKLVGQVDPKQTSLLLAMKEDLIRTEFIAKAEELPSEKNNVKHGIALALTNAKSKIKVNITEEEISVTIDLKMVGALDEYKWNKLSDREELDNIETKLEEEIESECNELIKKLQELGSDPIGIGNIFRAKHNYYWQSVNWEEEYKEMRISVNVDINIKYFGVIN